MKKSMRITALALAATLALSGCIKMEVNLELQSDDTVDGSMVFAVQEGLGELIGDAEGTGEILTDEEAAGDLFGDDLTSDFENATEEAYNEDGWVGTRVVFEGETLGGFSEDNGEFTIVREGDDFIVSGPFDTEATQEEGSEQLLEGAEMTMSVTFPGEVKEHNGTLEGNTVTWNLLDGPEELYAKGGATEGSNLPIGLIIGIIVGLLVVGGVILAIVLISRSRKKDDDLIDGTTPPPAPVIEP